MANPEEWKAVCSKYQKALVSLGEPTERLKKGSHSVVGPLGV